jgi:hypothetical protein
MDFVSAIPNDAPRPSRGQDQEGHAHQRVLPSPPSKPNGQGITASIRVLKSRGRDEAESTYIQISDHAGRTGGQNRVDALVDYYRRSRRRLCIAISLNEALSCGNNGSY